MSSLPLVTYKDLLKQDAKRAKMIRASGLQLDYDTVLHIGRHKAGTTALQSNLHHNSGVLAEQGFFYPELYPGTRHIAHHALSEMFQRRRPEADVANGIKVGLGLAKRLEAERFETLILSSENFQNIQPEKLSLVFDPARCTVVVYIREQYAYAQSAYSQAIHARKVTDSFPNYLARFKTHYDRFLGPWATVFTNARLRVQVYAREQLLNGDIIDDFCNIAGISMTGFGIDRSVSNPSIGGPLLTFKREINSLPVPQTQLAAAYWPLAKLAEDTPAFRQKPFVSAGAVETYRAQFTESNAAVAQRFFDRDRLFDIALPKEAEVQDDIAAIDGILEGLATTRQAPRLFTALQAGFAEAGSELSPYLAELKRRL